MRDRDRESVWEKETDREKVWDACSAMVTSEGNRHGDPSPKAVTILHNANTLVNSMNLTILLPQLWVVIVGQTGHFDLGMAIRLEEGKLNSNLINTI